MRREAHPHNTQRLLVYVLNLSYKSLKLKLKKKIEQNKFMFYACFSVLISTKYL